MHQRKILCSVAFFALIFLKALVSSFSFFSVTWWVKS